MHKILAINPGSTSTKVAIYEGNRCALVETISHDALSLKQFHGLIDQYRLRKKLVLQVIHEHGYKTKDFDAIVGRGGLLRPLHGGIYIVNQKMLDDCRQGVFGVHAANLGAVIAHEIATENGIPAFVVDPPVVDELDDVARVTGHPDISRKSMFHALNQKAVARRCAEEIGLEPSQARLIVAHLGGGITVAAHDRGRVVDVNNGYDAEGPMAPERAGTLPAGDLVQLCFSGKYGLEEIQRMLVGRGGLMGHLGINDLREVRSRIDSGDQKAKLCYVAMAYQIAKCIGSYACVLIGQVDAIVLTGGMAHDQDFTSMIIQRVNWIAPVRIYPGENEMESLAHGALRVLCGTETAQEYDSATNY